MSQIFSTVGELKCECQALESTAERWDFKAGMWGAWLGMKEIRHIGS